MPLGICLLVAMGEHHLSENSYHQYTEIGLGSIPKVIDSNRAILGGQIDRTSEWETLLPLNKTGFVRFLGINSHDIGVCFSERADRSPTVFWAFSEEIKDSRCSLVSV